MPKDRFAAVFIEEALEELQKAERDLLVLEKNPKSKESINSLFRSLHTIKGGAGMVGMDEVGEITHLMESLLTQTRASGEALSGEAVNKLFTGTDFARRLISGEDISSEIIRNEYGAILQTLEDLERRQGNIAADDTSLGKEEVESTCAFIRSFDEELKDTVIKGEKNIFLVNVSLSEDCLIKVARVYLAMGAVDELAVIVKVMPDLKEIEDGKMENDFSLIAVSEVDESLLEEILYDISEVDVVRITKIDLKYAEELSATGKSGYPGGNELIAGDSKGDIKFFRIDIAAHEIIAKPDIDLMMIFQDIYEHGIVLSSYVNTSRLPACEDIEPDKLYLSWVFFIEAPSSTTEMQLMDVFAFIEEEIVHVEDITHSLRAWFFERETLQEHAAKGFFDAASLDSILHNQQEIGLQLEEAGKIQDEEAQSFDDLTGKGISVKSDDYGHSDSIRVKTAKLENIIDNVGELIISYSRLKDMVFKLNDGAFWDDMELISAFEDSEKIINHLQEDVMNVSMVPVAGTFIRFQRMARDLAKELGKEVDLIISGGETELDKKIIEHIVDPLKHLIRNAIGHGIETPSERKKAMKGSRGCVELSAYHYEGKIIIEVSDDGGGINEEEVLARARELKLVKEGEKPDKEAIMQMVFLPGFTTSKELSGISGRGVGLDVVMNNIQSLSGQIEIFSQKGKGTRFVIKLPLTMAIIAGMLVRVGDELFIIPLNTIIEFYKAEAEEVCQAEGKGLFLYLRDMAIPYMGLYQIFSLDADFKKPHEGILVILKEGKRKMALMVDEIIGHEQVVIKSVKENLGHLAGMAGATIMGDGRIVVILDVLSILDLVRNNDYSIFFGEREGKDNPEVCLQGSFPEETD